MKTAAMTKTDDSAEEEPAPDHVDGPPDRVVDEHPAPAGGVDSPQRGSAIPSVGSGGRAASETQLAAWIEAIVDHDERALAALYDATFNHVFGLVRRIVRNTAVAEEVVEDAYFQLWRQAARFDPARGKPLTWLLAMARSRALDALRREARRRHDGTADDESLETASPAAPADELLDLARHRADLHEALMLLDAQPRQLVSLAFFRGLSHEEIADQKRLPLGTVKSQIRRALLSLRRILDGGGTSALAS